MFADNDRISQRQLLRQMILALLGAWLLFLAGGVCQAGQNGLAGMTLGFLLLAGWLLLLIRNAGVYENMEHYIGKAGRLLVIIVYLSFLVLTGSFFAAKDQQPLWRISDQRDIAGIPWASAFACRRGRNQK